MDIRKGMSGLKQVRKISNNRLQLHLVKCGYAPVARTPSLWKHASKNITLPLIVDNFGVKYVGKQHNEHLIQVLQQLYTISIDCTGTLFCGLTFAWDYKNLTCDISMSQYLKEALHRFQHPVPQRPKDAPHSWNRPTHSAAVQYATNNDISPLLPAKSITLIQQIVGTLLYYGIAVDPTMLIGLGSIISHQSKATKKTH